MKKKFIEKVLRETFVDTKRYSYVAGVNDGFMQIARLPIDMPYDHSKWEVCWKSTEQLPCDGKRLCRVCGTVLDRIYFPTFVTGQRAYVDHVKPKKVHCGSFYCRDCYDKKFN